MKFEPQTDAQIAEAGLLPDADYDIEVFEAEERTSQAGNAMIVLKLRVFADSGHRDLTDYIVSNLAWKVKGAASGFGLLSEYEDGELSADDFLGKTGRAAITRQPAQNGYGPKNVLKAYLAKAGAAPRRVMAPAGGGGRAMDDDIPFAAEWR